MVKPLEKSIKFWDGHGLLRIVELHVGEGTETDIARRKGGHGGEALLNLTRCTRIVLRRWLSSWLSD